jgi:hypothetical protein
MVFVPGLRAAAPKGARFDSPGRSRRSRRSPGYAIKNWRKAQRAEIPGAHGCHARHGIAPRWGFGGLADGQPRAPLRCALGYRISPRWGFLPSMRSEQKQCTFCSERTRIFAQPRTRLPGEICPVETDFSPPAGLASGGRHDSALPRNPSCHKPSPTSRARNVVASVTT